MSDIQLSLDLNTLEDAFINIGRADLDEQDASSPKTDSADKSDGDFPQALR